MTKKATSTAERLKTAQLLLGVTDRVAGLDSLDEILETLVSLTTDQLGAERSSIFLNQFLISFGFWSLTRFFKLSSVIKISRY